MSRLAAGVVGIGVLFTSLGALIHLRNSNPKAHDGLPVYSNEFICETNADTTTRVTLVRSASPPDAYSGVWQLNLEGGTAVTYQQRPGELCMTIAIERMEDDSYAVRRP